MRRLFFAILLGACAHAIPWIDERDACVVDRHTPTYGVLCSLGPRGVCNGTDVTVSSAAPCSGAARFSIDTHGRHDVRWREVSRDPGPCGGATFRAESLTPCALSALSVRSACVSQTCSARNVTVSTSRVSRCSSAEVAGTCGELPTSMISVAFPNNTICPGKY